MASIQIHFDGQIAKNHQVSLKVLGKTLTHLQNAINRSFLDINSNGRLQKHKKISKKNSLDVEFLVESPREGGYILDFFSKTSAYGDKIIERLRKAIEVAFQESFKKSQENSLSIKEEIDKQIKSYEESNSIELWNKDEFVESMSATSKKTYADRAIVRELDQILSLIRSSSSTDSIFELSLVGTSTKKFSFDKERSDKFHNIISEKRIGQPLLFKVSISSLDRPNLVGKVVNSKTKKTYNLRFIDEHSFKKVISFFEEDKEMIYIGVPLIEYESFDPIAGDIYFINIPKKKEHA